MIDENKTKEQLIAELAELRRCHFDEACRENRSLTFAKIRDVIWGMRTADDIWTVAATIREGLELLNVNFNGFGINTVNSIEDELSVNVWEVGIDGEWRHGIGSEGENVIFDVWRKQTINYRTNLSDEDRYDESAYLENNFNSPVRSVIDFPFSHGTLALNSLEADAFSAIDISLLGDMARMLSEGFKRTDDLRKLEKYTAGLEKEIVERKKAEKALRESEKLFMDISYSMADWIWEIDSNGVFTFASGKVKEVFGYEPEELLGNTPFDFMPEEEGVKIKTLFFEFMNNREEINNLENWNVSKNGDPICFLTNGIPVFDKYGDLSGYRGVDRDITERKLAEEALKKSKQFNETLVNLSPDILYIYDIIEKKNIFSNDGIVRVLGHTVEEVQEMGSEILPILMHPDDFKNYIENTVPKYFDIKDGELVRHQYRMKNKNGEWHWLDSNETIYLRQADGSPQQIFGVIHDISAAKQAEEVLRQSETFLKDAGRMAKVGGWEIDLRTKELEWSEEVFHIHDLPLDHKLDVESTINCYSPEHKPIISEAIANAIDHGESFDLDLKLLTANKKHRWVRVLGKQISADGVPVKVSGVIQDVTDHKHLEEQLQIRERMDSLGTLAGGIAHDFNNLLAGIMGNLDLLRMDIDILPPDQQENLVEAHNLCKRSAKLIKSFQSLTYGSVSVPANVDIYKIASEVFSILSRTTNKLIEKNLDIEPNLFYVDGLAEQIHQVFLNLGTNAFQAIEESGVTKDDYIKISAREYEVDSEVIGGLSTGVYTHIMFEDTGCGMSSEVIRKAFNPLFSTKERGVQKGQGLGLAMVYNIVTRNHKGFINIESEEGKGTTFNIYLPRATKAASSTDDKPDDFRGGGETILIIDDEPVVRELFEKSLERFGYSTLSAADGVEGLKIFVEKQQDIDLVLLDLTMPVMSGDEVLEKMIAIDPATRVIISTGQSEVEIAHITQAKGFVSKPFELAELAKVVRDVLDS